MGLTEAEKWLYTQAGTLDHTGAECHGATQANTTPCRRMPHTPPHLATCRFPSVTTSVHKVYCCSLRLIVNKTATIRISAWPGFIQVQSGRGCCRPQNAAKKRNGVTRARMHGGRGEFLRFLKEQGGPRSGNPHRRDPSLGLPSVPRAV